MKKNFLVLVTGSCGFVGKNLLKRLLHEKHLSIIGTYNRRVNFIKNSKIKYIKVNTAKNRDYENITKVPDAIVHLSNKVLTSEMLKKKKKINLHNNLLSIINLLDFCKVKKIKKLVYISSSTGYPILKKKLKEKDYFLNEPADESYIIGSLSRILEKIIYIYKKIYNLKTEIVVLRPSAIYGRYDNFDIRSSRLIPNLISRVISNKFFITIPGSGSLVRNWINISEFVNIIAEIIFLKNKKKILTMNICSDKSYSTLQMTQKIIKILNKKNFAIRKKFFLEKKLNTRLLDSTKMKNLCLTVDKNSIDYYLKDTIKWYKNRSK